MLELQAAMSLSRLWHSRASVTRPCPPGPIYGWFTEGFDTANLQEAKALLKEWGTTRACTALR